MSWAAACENRDIWPFKKGPKLITTILLFAYLQKSRFGSTQILRILSQKMILEGSQDPTNRRCHYFRESNFAGSWDPFRIVFWRRFLKNWVLPHLDLSNNSFILDHSWRVQYPCFHKLQHFLAAAHDTHSYT